MDEPLVETELADSEPQRRSGPWKLIVAVAVVTLIGVWLVPGKAPEPVRVDADRSAPPPRDAAPSLLGAAEPGPAPAAIQAPALPEVDAAVDDRPGARARALIAQLRAAGDIDLAQVHAAAVQAQADAAYADAYLLYFFAAREGHAASALALGRQADPASRDPDNSVFTGADLTQAHKWLQIAADAGDADARARLADLRSRIERLAADGDAQAQRLSLLWQ